jgi:hypothetical protein
MPTHLFVGGGAACGTVKGPVRDWPQDHYRVGPEDAAAVDCPDCIKSEAFASASTGVVVGICYGVLRKDHEKCASIKECYHARLGHPWCTQYHKTSLMFK